MRYITSRVGYITSLVGVYDLPGGVYYLPNVVCYLYSGARPYVANSHVGHADRSAGVASGS